MFRQKMFSIRTKLVISSQRIGHIHLGTVNLLLVADAHPISGQNGLHVSPIHQEHEDLQRSLCEMGGDYRELFLLNIACQGHHGRLYLLMSQSPSRTQQSQTGNGKKWKMTRLLTWT